MTLPPHRLAWLTGHPYQRRNGWTVECTCGRSFTADTERQARHLIDVHADVFNRR